MTPGSLPSCQKMGSLSHDFLQATHFSEEDLTAELRSLEAVMNLPSGLDCGDDVIDSIQCGRPTVVTCDTGGCFQPDFFIQHYEKVACSVVSSGGHEEASTVGKFFRDYGKSNSRKKLKVSYLKTISSPSLILHRTGPRQL